MEVDSSRRGAEKAVALRRVEAFGAVEGMNLPEKISITSAEFDPLPLQVRRFGNGLLWSLKRKHGSKLPYLFGISLRESWFAIYLKALSYAEANTNTGTMNELMLELATPEAQYKYDGFSAAMFFGDLGSTEESREQAAFRAGTPYRSRVPLPELLFSCATYWLSLASQAVVKGDLEEAMNWVQEANNAIVFATSPGQREALEIRRSKGAEARRMLGRSGGLARHEKSRADKARVFEWCDKNIDRFTSMDDAAFDIAETFVPQKFRTVRDWMTEWRRVRSAG